MRPLSQSVSGLRPSWFRGDIPYVSYVVDATHEMQVGSANCIAQAAADARFEKKHVANCQLQTWECCQLPSGKLT